MDDERLGPAVGQLTVPGGNPYIFAYFYGWDLVGRWLDTPDPAARVRRLLTEQLLPTDLTPY